MSLFQEFDPLVSVALCPPTYLALSKPINVIQERELRTGVPISASLAQQNHEALRRALTDSGVRAVMVDPDPAFPFQTNARDAGLATPDGFISSRFRLPVRDGEERLARASAQAEGLAILGCVTAGAFEGGDFVALSSTHAAVGLGARTEAAVLPELERLLGPEVQLSPVPFAPRFLHLDMIFNVVAPGIALACLSALPNGFTAVARASGLRLLEVSEDEVFRHGCNVLALGFGRVLSHRANGRINAVLKAEGIELLVVDVSELARSGGGPRCLTLPLRRSVGIR